VTGRPGLLHIDDLPIGGMRLVHVDGRRICLVRTSSGVHALDNTCPHEGYGLTQGSIDGELLTCAWHNWKFRVGDGACVQGEEDVRPHPVTVGPDGWITVDLYEPDPAEARAKLLVSLRRGIEHDYIGQVSRDVIRLLQASANPGELVWEAVAYGAPRAEFGWGHSVAVAADCLSVVDQYEGDQRALPIVQAIAGIAETERGRPVRSLPAPVSRLPADGATAFRRAMESEDVEGSQALVLAGIDAGLGANELRRWFTGAVSDHHLSYGHGAIYSQKAFQLLDVLGWDRAPTVLPHLVPTLVYGTREDLLPYMRPFMKGLVELDLTELAEIEEDRRWRDDGAVLAAFLGRDKRAPLAAAIDALRAGAGVDGLLDVVVAAVSERLLRYDVSNEFVLEDDFGWLDITHGLTYANAARWLHHHEPGPDTLRLALFCVFLAHWTGRHEWHTAIGERLPTDGGPSAGDLLAACLEQRPADAAAAATSADLADAGTTLQQAALLDRTTATIVHAHAVKTSTAAAVEAARTGSTLPLAATARFLAAPRLERFVAANVNRSIEFLAGRAPRD
jgi:nitrite reductase/ring-hydroxylating ferredoxin subunit